MLAMFMSARQWWTDDAVANFWKPAAETQLHDECANCNMIVKAEKYKETHYRQGCISSLKCEKQSKFPPFQHFLIAVYAFSVISRYL